MNPTEQQKPAFRLRKAHVAALVIVGMLLACAAGVAGYFRLGSETRALRGSLMATVAGQWEKKFAVHVGWLTLGLVRVGTRCVNLPPEPRAALDALHGLEVGVYRLQHQPVSLDRRTIFPDADRVMRVRGWERIVGVVRSHELVGIYIPRKGLSPGRMACCLVVLKDRDLVVASARGSLEPLLRIAAKHLDSADIRNAVNGGALQAYCPPASFPSVSYVEAPAGRHHATIVCPVEGAVAGHKTFRPSSKTASK